MCNEGKSSLRTSIILADISIIHNEHLDELRASGASDEKYFAIYADHHDPRVCQLLSVDPSISADSQDDQVCFLQCSWSYFIRLGTNSLDEHISILGE